jgi:DNA-binding transcriptional regulator YiaG
MQNCSMKKENTKQTQDDNERVVLQEAASLPEAARLNAYRNHFKVPQPLVVRMTGFSARSVAKWAAGELPSPRQAKTLAEADRLLEGLARIMEPGQIGAWLRKPNAAFEGSTPIQVVERGEVDRLWRMLYYIESGLPA